MPVSIVHSILSKKESAHDDPIYCCTWAKIKPTGDSNQAPKNFIVTGGLDCLIKVWILENDKLELLHTLEGHEMAVVSVATSLDGHTLASTSLDSTLIIWDLVSGLKVHKVKTGAIDVWQVSFSPDGSQAVTGSHDGKLMIYNVEKGVRDRVFDTRGQFVTSVAWSRDGKLIASGSVDGVVCIFDVAQGKMVHTTEAHTQAINSVDFSPNARWLVTASKDGKVKTYNATSASLQSELEHKSWVLAARFSADGNRVAVAAADGSVRLALLTEGLKVIHTFQEHTDCVCDVYFNAESNKLVSVSKDKSIVIYECPIPSKSTKK